MKRIKKALPIALVVASLLAIFALSAFAADCLHPNYTWTDQAPSSCGDWIIRVYSCPDCGEVWEDGLEIMEHNYKTTVTEPTCTQSGSTKTWCTKCGDTSETEIEPTGHEWDENWHEPTCTTGGWSNAICSVCGEIDDSQYQDYGDIYPPVNHTPVDGVCSVCGKEVVCKNHDYVYDWCGAETHIQKCTVCGETAGSEVGHVWSNKTFIESIDESIAWYQYTCSDCGYKTKFQELKTCENHEWDYIYMTETQHRKYCLNCGVYGDYGNHVFDQGKVTATPTEDHVGIKTFTCSICNGTKTEIIEFIDIDLYLPRMTNEQAEEIFTKIFFYQAEEDYGRWQWQLMENNDICYWYVEYFTHVIFDDIAENGTKSEYYDQFKTLYYDILNTPGNSSDYQKGYHDAMSSVIDENPIQGLFQSMWASVLLFVTTVANGVGISGISLMSVLVTVAILALVWFIVKLVRG